MTKGREVPALPTVTLPDSGYTVGIRPLGPSTLQHIGEAARKELTRPTPPINTVTGLDEQEKQVENTADPDYLAAMDQYEQDIQMDIGQRLLKIMQAYAVVYEPDLAALNQFREGMAAGGVTFDDDDRSVWFWHFLLSSQRDSQELIQAVVRRSQPTPEVVDAKVASFSDPVQGA